MKYNGISKEDAGQLEILAERFYRRPTENRLDEICNSIVDTIKRYELGRGELKHWFEYYLFLQEYHKNKGEV